MRNFEERMAEIQKRSHARIARRRHQITALCVPLVAALCVSGALLIPQQTAYDPVDTVPTETAVMQDSGSVTVMNGSVSVTCSSRETVDALQRLVSSLSPVQDTPVTMDEKNNHEFTFQATSLTEKYTIILETEEGTAQYRLIGKILKNMDTDEQYALTDTQRAELLKLLELI